MCLPGGASDESYMVGMVSSSSGRAAAIRDCNVQAGKYKQYLWGDYEIDAYRACMAQRGQQE